ncbi:MAG: monofunctional biosynthetic peptidoglycan transglycosylase [Bacteroidaceae bacterium]|nr:monofunctional biosynthetic peptidoglycan transglycosylase [Bacteroidaceae bacterium]
MNFLRKLRKFIQRIVLLFFGSTIFFVCLYRFVPVYLTPFMVIETVKQPFRGEKIRLKHHWVPLEQMSPYLPTAVMCSEDTKFLKHHGFDFEEIGKVVKGKRHGGASTISQQTAKNAFLWKGESKYTRWTRKAIEPYFTLLIELVWGKRRIMEVYLNSIEMGPGIYGAEAVAQQHFGCSAANLTRRQCALIAASLPNPVTMNSSAPSSYMLRRQTQILQDMRFVERNKLFDLSIFETPQEQ